MVRLGIDSYISMISHLVDKKLLYESYLNNVILSLLFIVRCEGNYRGWLFATSRNYYKW